MVVITYIWRNYVHFKTNLIKLAYANTKFIYWTKSASRAF